MQVKQEMTSKETQKHGEIDIEFKNHEFFSCEKFFDSQNRLGWANGGWDRVQNLYRKDESVSERSLRDFFKNPDSGFIDNFPS